jgi:hypothetical protein
MNEDEIVIKVLSKTIRVVSKKKFENEIELKKQVDKLIDSIQTNLVKLRLTSVKFKEDKTDLPYQHWKVELEVFFDLDDVYVDNKVYESGTVHIFPSKKFYGDMNRNSMTMFEAYPEWNSTRTVATITGKARNY